MLSKYAAIWGALHQSLARMEAMGGLRCFERRIVRMLLGVGIVEELGDRAWEVRNPTGLDRGRMANASADKHIPC